MQKGIRRKRMLTYYEFRTIAYRALKWSNKQRKEARELAKSETETAENRNLLNALILLYRRYDAAVRNADNFDAEDKLIEKTYNDTYVKAMGRYKGEER